MLRPRRRVTASRTPNVDLFRALAISVVVLCNTAVEQIGGTGVAHRAMLSGWMGVDLFFVLSGWLVGGLYWRERAAHGGVETGRFWARRWLRTVPPYLVALHVFFVAKLVAVDPSLTYDAHFLAFLQNYLLEPPYWAVSWSLAVEEHFYLALPLVLWAATRVRHGVPILLGAAVVGSFAARVALPLGAVDGVTGLHYTATHLRLEGLALGVLAAWVYTERAAWWPAWVRWARRLVVPAVAALALVAVLPAASALTWGFGAVDVAWAVLVVATVTGPDLPAARSRVVTAVAVASYSVYMTHTAALEGVRTLLPDLAPVAQMAVALAAVAGVGAAFYALVERPTMVWRERLAPRRSGQGSPLLVDLGAPSGDGVETGEAPVVHTAPAVSYATVTSSDR